MKFRFQSQEDADTAERAIYEEFEGSRFRLPSQVERRLRGKKGFGFDINGIRLVSSKEYCGNHPAACEIGNPGHRKHNYLEGADWVEFNDRVNNALDRHHLWANVTTIVCELRRGRLRRVYYDGHKISLVANHQWNRYAEIHDYQDWCGRQAPASGFPVGTPGRYGDVYDVVG